jgi:hypothetical protein
MCDITQEKNRREREKERERERETERGGLYVGWHNKKKYLSFCLSGFGLA